MENKKQVIEIIELFNINYYNLNFASNVVLKKIIKVYEEIKKNTNV